MRIAVLYFLLAVGIAVFLAMFASVWRYRARAMGANGAAEYIWALIPSLIVALCAAPAVHRALADASR